MRDACMLSYAQRLIARQQSSVAALFAVKPRASCVVKTCPHLGENLLLNTRRRREPIF
jgi:hypothetical protein